MSRTEARPADTNGAGQPATPLQERFWFLQRYEADASSQARFLTVDLYGDLSPDELKAAVRSTLQRHPQLFRKFRVVDGSLRVEPMAGEIPDVPVIQVESTAELGETITGVQCRHLDLESGRTFVGAIIACPTRLLLSFVAHACVADQRSLEFLLFEIAGALGWSTAEAIRCSSTPVQINRSDSPERRFSRDEAYWQRRIGDTTSPLQLPTIANRPTRKRYEARRLRFDVPASAAERADMLCRRIGCSPYALYLAAFLSTLRRWSRQDVVTVGRYVDLRPPASPAEVGAYTDVLPFRFDFAAEMTLTSMVERVDSMLKEDAAHGTISFRRLTDLLQVPRDPSRHAVFQAAFGFSERPPIVIRSAHWSAIEATDEEPVRTPCDLELHVEHGGATPKLTILFDPALHDESMMRRFSRHLINLVDRASDGAGVDSVEILDHEEAQELLQLSRGPTEPIVHTSVHEMFVDSVRRFADSPALVHGETVLTFRELDAFSNRVAHELARSGARPGSRVGICLDRSVEMIASVLAVLKIGAAYVPMDPSYPEERLRIMAEDASIALIVAHRLYAARFPSDLRVAVYEDFEPGLASVPDSYPPARVDADDLAYVIFTSGSTGRPKGVAMPHRALVNLIEWQLDRKPFVERARVLQYSSLSFDVSFQEIFSTFASGGTLHLIEDGERRDPRRLLDALIEQRIQRLFLPYVALRQMIEAAHARGKYPRTLDEVITAGEQLRVDDALRSFFLEIGGASLDNQYGPSETHVVTAHMLTGDPAAWPALPPIGRPIRNNQAFVLDDHGSLAPLGVPGELHLAGTNVARGYFGREELTRERFITRTFAPGPMYRTGDLASYRPDGSLEFLGRTDFQVKIRGYRIEPNEINEVLGRFPGVKQALTRAIDDVQGGKRLVSYALVDDGTALDIDAVYRLAREQLPEYMLPSAILPLTELPFTPSGKLDLKALPIPETRTNDTRRLAPPRTAVEAELAQIWRELLALDEVGIDESFFDLGGDSLKAVELFLAIEQRFDVDLPLSTLVEKPTIAALAAVLDAGASDDLVQFRALRRIQKGSPGRTPIYLVHGGGGNVVIFGPLARAVSADLPVYAFQWDGWTGERGRTSIEEMADLYVAELLQFQPQGPYRLGGHCVGGLIALEMARRLRRLGHQVIDPIIVTDAPNLSARSYRPSLPAEGSRDLELLTACRTELENLLAGCEPHPVASQEAFEPPAHHRNRIRRRLVRLAKPVHKVISRRKFNAFRFNQALDRQIIRLCRLTGRKVPLPYRSVEAGATITRAVRNYRPLPYDRPVVYFRTGVFLGENLGLGGWWSDSRLGFGELCTGGLEVHYINATHNGVLLHPRTAQIIRRIVTT